MTDQDRTFWLAIRQALIIMIGALEDRLGLQRSIVPKRKRATYGTMYSNTSTRDVEEFSGTD